MKNSLMKSKNAYLCLALLLSLLSCIAAHAQSSRELVIRNVTVIPMTMDTLLKNKTVVIRNSTIRDISDNHVASSNATIIKGIGHQERDGDPNDDGHPFKKQN